MLVLVRKPQNVEFRCPNPAFRQTRANVQVSRAWKEAVESQITHLRNQDTTVLLNDASSLPRDLPARFPRLGTLDLGENRDYSARENEVNQAILSMPNLRELLGYACIKGLRQLDSPQHLEQVHFFSPMFLVQQEQFQPAPWPAFPHVCTPDLPTNCQLQTTSLPATHPRIWTNLLPPQSPGKFP